MFLKSGDELNGKLRVTLNTAVYQFRVHSTYLIVVELGKIAPDRTELASLECFVSSLRADENGNLQSNTMAKVIAIRKSCLRRLEY